MKFCHEMHPVVIYDDEREPICPVCAAVQERDMALASKDEEIEELKGTILDFEEKIDGYRSELRL